jgi:hypothetical protein
MASQYYSATAYVGTPHRNAVEVTIPLVGPAGPAGEAGEAGGEDVETYIVTTSTFTVPAVRAARVFIDMPPGSDVTITLNASSPQNLDRVEVILVKIPSGFKVTVATGGFGDFDIFGTQKATFVYGANISPARWVKAFDNVFQEAEPTAVSSIGQPGAIAYADNFLYICIGNNSWRRVAVSTWQAET